MDCMSIVINQPMRYNYSENKSKKKYTDCTRNKLYDWQPSVGM